MRKKTTTAKLTEFEIKRNKKISKVRHIVEKYFGLSHLQGSVHDHRKKTKLITGIGKLRSII